MIKELVIAKAGNGFVIRTSDGNLTIAASLAQVVKVLKGFYNEPEAAE